MSLIDKSPVGLEALSKLLNKDMQDKADAERYRKLRRWMSSNVKEGWEEVSRLGAIASYVDWDAFDAYLDELPVCNVGLCHVRQE